MFSIGLGAPWELIYLQICWGSSLETMRRSYKLWGSQTKPTQWVSYKGSRISFWIITFSIVNSGKPEHKRTRSQNSGEGISLVVQWLRLYAPNAGASQVVLVIKNPPASAGDIRDVGLIPGSGRSPGRHSNSVQYSCLKNPMDREAWWAIVHRVAKS